MLAVRKSEERGHADHGWLNTYHTFSFASYYDREHMGFRTLRVINEDRVQAGAGFPTHPHANMEIISYVVSGRLAHKDSMGNVKTIGPGEVQAMTAGSGITHSEYNPSESEPVHFLQIWAVPAERDLKPEYSQKHFSLEKKANRLCLLVSPDGADGSLPINQDVRLFGSILEAGESLHHQLEPGRGAWIQLIKGRVTVNGRELSQGDGLAVEDEEAIRLESSESAEFLMFDLA